MENNKKPTKGEQRKIDACENVINWTHEDRKHRGCIVITTEEKSSTYAMIGQSQNFITALALAIKSTPNLRGILATVMMLDMVTGGSKSDTDKD